MKVEMCVPRGMGALEHVSVETRTVAKGSRSVLMRRVRERRETLTARRMHRRIAARKRCMVVSRIEQAAAQRCSILPRAGTLYRFWSSRRRFAWDNLTD
jgi:hypothetical protein